MIRSRSAITVALVIISLASGTTQAYKCYFCMDTPTDPNPACRVNTFDPTSVDTQNPTTPISITIPTSTGSINLSSSDFDCSTACAIYTSAAQSFTARSCHTTANILAAFPDVQVQNCHRDYCNTSPLFPDTPSPNAPRSLQCYACFDSVQLGSSVVGCGDSNFQPAQIPIQQYGTYFEIGTIVIPPAYFDCSACAVVKIPSIGLTVRGCSTTYNLASLGYPDVQTQTCHTDRCNGYPLIADKSAASSFQLGLSTRIGLVLGAVVSMIFLS